MKAILAALIISLWVPHQAFAWGDDGHKVVALIAEHYLTPEVRNTVAALLAQDTDPLTEHDIASEATWADKYRNHHRETASWHFVDIELDNPDIDAACHGRAPLPAGVVASNGPPDCVLDKIRQFADELKAPGTDPEERLVALKFVLHFVGDMHQPLHSSDNHDKGGNAVKVIVDGFPHKTRDELHAFWDTQFVDGIEGSPSALAEELLATITPAQKAEWEKRSLDDWAMEAFEISKSDVYGDPPLSTDEVQHLGRDYVERAEKDVALQLSRAGVRLAAVLNGALGSTKGSTPSVVSSISVGSDRVRIPLNAPIARAPSGINQFTTEADAKKHCPSGTVVWANLRSNVYHFAGYPNYGNTAHGAYMCDVDADRERMHAAKTEHP
jgi:hypothetical protein